LVEAESKLGSAGRATRRDRAAVRGRAGRRGAHEGPAFAVPPVLAFIGYHSIRCIQSLAAIDQIEMHLQALSLFAARGVNQVHAAHIEAFHQRVLMLRRHLSDIRGHRGEHGVVQIRTDCGRVGFLQAALDEKESHLRTLQKGFDFEARILRADGIDGGG